MNPIQLQVNGESRECEAPCTVTQLLHELELRPELVAVEYNGDVLRRSVFPETLLADGDRLEIVRFVQGG